MLIVCTVALTKTPNGQPIIRKLICMFIERVLFNALSLSLSLSLSLCQIWKVLIRRIHTWSNETGLDTPDYG